MANEAAAAAKEALLKKIAEVAPGTQQTLGLLRLSEAYAYLVSPSQSHGSGSQQSGS